MRVPGRKVGVSRVPERAPGRWRGAGGPRARRAQPHAPRLPIAAVESLDPGQVFVVSVVLHQRGVGVAHPACAQGITGCGGYIFLGGGCLGFGGGTRVAMPRARRRVQPAQADACWPGAHCPQHQPRPARLTLAAQVRVALPEGGQVVLRVGGHRMHAWRGGGSPRASWGQAAQWQGPCSAAGMAFEALVHTAHADGGCGGGCGGDRPGMGISLTPGPCPAGRSTILGFSFSASSTAWLCTTSRVTAGIPSVESSRLQSAVDMGEWAAGLRMPTPPCCHHRPQPPRMTSSGQAALRCPAPPLFLPLPAHLRSRTMSSWRWMSSGLARKARVAMAAAAAYPLPLLLDLVCLVLLKALRELPGSQRFHAGTWAGAGGETTAMRQSDSKLLVFHPPSPTPQPCNSAAQKHCREQVSIWAAAIGRSAAACCDACQQQTALFGCLLPPMLSSALYCRK